MLIRFAVENFMSFKNMTEFNMAAGKIVRHKEHVAQCNGKKILKGAFIFGANASGKTNLTRAIAFAKGIVEDGLENTNCDKKFFRVDDACKLKPSVFQFDIYANNHFYSYGFALSLINGIILEEWLYKIDDMEECVFLRSKDDDSDRYTLSSEMSYSNDQEKARFEFYAEDICSPKMASKLFLTDVAMRSPDEEDAYQPFCDVVNWFKRLTIIFPESEFTSIAQLLDEKDEKTRLENLLQYFDTGIIGIEKTSIPVEKIFNGMPENLLDTLKVTLAKKLTEDSDSVNVMGGKSQYEIRFSEGQLIASRIVNDHGNRNDLFDFSDESDGTQRLFDLIPIYRQALSNRVIVVDELDRSLHTKAVQEFINLFYKFAATNESQLIVTTHDSNIMDLELVRQDEIWFVERQADHSSKIYSLYQFKERFDKKVEKEYLLGRYGAVPIFDQFIFNEDSTEEGDTDGCYQ